MPTVLVSGGGSGIGAEAVRLLAQRDYQVVVADIDLVRGREVAEAIGGRFLQLDVGDGESWQQVPAGQRRVLPNYGPTKYGRRSGL
jgi:NAD(P)-dependent dehydrogenase (short-subunit alcohol dehydrogenase family)